MKIAKEPLISVVITCYNYADYVGQAVESVLGQTYEGPLEIIVIDDGSTDNSEEVIRSYSAIDNITILTRENKGVISTRNEGLGLSKGEYIIQLDADDILDPDYIKKCLSTAKNTGADIVYTQERVFGRDEFITEFPEYNLEKIKCGNIIHMASLIRRASIRGRQFDEHLRSLGYEDWDFFLGMCLDGAKAVLVDEPLLLYRTHKKKVSRTDGVANGLKELNARAYIIDKYIQHYPGQMGHLTQIKNTLYAAIREIEHLIHTDTVNDNNQVGEKVNFVRIIGQKIHHLTSGVLSSINEAVVDYREKRRGLSIIVPVYADWTSLKACLHSLKRFAPPAARIVIINDCGPDANSLEGLILEEIDADSRFHYYRNSKNLGFVKTCNLGVSYARQNDNILLLNSDAELTNGAIKELEKALHRAHDIASVSPRSNNATVFSVPFDYRKGRVVEAEKSYSIYKKLKSLLPEVYETPTTHGFCMLIRRTVIKKYGLFDEVFGAGYGEENDFCMRVRQYGYTHAIANRAYVFHEGSKSFTEKVRSERSEKNITVIMDRYPDYNELIWKYIQQSVVPEQELISNLR